MLYSKINKNFNHPKSIMVSSIILGIIVGIISSFIFFVIPTHFIGMIKCIIFGFIIAIMIVGEIDSNPIFLISIPLASLVVFEIIYEWGANSLMYSWWVYVVILLIVTEILFLLDKTQPNTIDKDKVMWFTTERKIEALVEASIILVLLKSIRRETSGIDIIKFYIIKFYPVALDALTYIIGIILVIVLLYIFIWINSFRYKKV